MKLNNKFTCIFMYSQSTPIDKKEFESMNKFRGIEERSPDRDLLRIII